jgi:hypothetical protein
MVTRDEIEAEAKFIRHLIDSANPTKTAHAPTPWQKAPGSLGDYGIARADDIGVLIANFQREADRDLALYFVNAHAGMLMLMRSQANAFRFIAKAAGDDAGLRSYANSMAELADIYVAGFASMGATFAGKAPEPPSL